MASSVLAKMAVQITANNARFEAAMRKSRAELTAFQQTAQTVKATLAGFGIGFGALELVRGVQFVMRTMMDFEATMSEVKAITGATGDELKALEADARRLGGSTKFTATQVGQLQIAYARLGFSTREILDATEATLDLAAATGEDLAKSADIAGATVRGFGLDASETKRVTDVMASSFNKSALSLENFTESMKYVAPIAKAAGATVEETTAMLGVLADAGVRGSQAGTSLRKIFTDMTRDGRPLKERLQELATRGITLADSYDEVGRTAQTALLILSENTSKTDQLTEALQKANGEAAKMAETMQDNLTGDITILKSAIEGLILQFKEGTGPIRDMTQGLTNLIALVSNDKLINFLKETTRIGAAVPLFIADLVGKLNAWIKANEKLNKELEEMDKKAIEDAFGGKDAPETIEKTGDAVEEVVHNLESLRKKESELLALYAKIASADVKRREDVAAQVRSIREEIRALEDLLKVRDKINTDFSRFQRPERHRAGQGEPDIDGQLGYMGDPYDLRMKGNYQVRLSDRDLESPVAGIVAEIEVNDELARSLANLEKERRKQIDAMYAQADAAQVVGEAIGEAFVNAAIGQEQFAQSLARLTEQIITMYLRQSIAAMIKTALEDPSTPFPFAKVAVAAAGIGAVRALFSQIGAGGAGGGGGSHVPVGRRPSEVTRVSVEGRIRGYDLQLTSRKEAYRQSIVG